MSPGAPAGVTEAGNGHARSTAVTTRGAEGPPNLVAQLQAVVNQLSVNLSEAADGDSWFHLDAALRALHGALVALSEVDRAMPDLLLAPPASRSEPPPGLVGLAWPRIG
jgi:hypothetical protein